MAVLSEEQSMLRDAAKSWVQEQSPVGALRKLRGDGAGLGFDPAAWREMGQMGWAGVVIPEAHGGSEFGWLSLGLVLEEMGRTLAASPLLATSAAAAALTLGGTDDQKAEWLPKLAGGEVIGALAVDEGPHHAPGKIALKAERSAVGWTLTGAKTFVLDGMAADLLVVAARTSGQPGEASGITLFLVPGDAAGLKRQALKLADSRGAANISFEGVEVRQDAALAGGLDLLDQVLDRARALLAAEMLGSASQAFETTLDYLKTRVQFGQVIGSFQALQHRAAKMYVELELARSAVEAALAALDAQAPNAAELVSLAKTRAGETFHLVSNEMVQMHGGIGMTDEHDAGLYLKRARAAEAAFGGQAFHRDRYARLQGF
ncbi:acyl-CoA dehydrogenase family protein [Phenylobacterium deserti]|uniref:Acyl-CoA dehydrogenase n=1 Tax=Phenylobacterium deserti TaxID=1914756 RepID=A0A328ATI1_9CAUL|nr:acyl-CoA dehydrogenase family protein [Phenylobacterium deserti]RAK56804.1 acyl-CoA dehydrogenase [Phenylobacterium deserti]